MTIRYKCRKCGCILYDFSEISDYRGLLTPYEIAYSYDFTCPNCKAQLNPNIDNPDWREHIVISVRREEIKKSRKKRKEKKRKERKETKIEGITWIDRNVFIINEI